MLRLTTICVLILAYVSLAHSYKEHNGTVRIDLIRQKTPREQQINAPHLKKYGLNFDWLYTSHKYGMNRTNDSISLFRYLDNEFYGQIVIGSPGRTMNVAFDTAWKLSWVISSRCQQLRTVGCLFHNKYDHDRSSFYRKDGRPYIGDEGTFNFTGFYSYENISIAHSNVTNFSFVEMVDVPSSLLFSKADGVLGLGLKGDDDYEPFFYALYRQKKILNPIFSIYLNRDPQSNKGGNIMLGFVDQKHIHKTQLKNGSIIPEEITYLNVDPGEYWQFSVDSIVLSIDRNKNTTLCPTGCKAISDTSSTDIVGPPADIEEIHKQMNAKQSIFGKWMVKCDTVSKLPKIYFVLGGKPFKLEGKQYIIKMSYFSFTLCVSAFSPAETSSEEGLWVLGGAFLSQYYSIYDIDKKEIGFVTAA